MALSPCTFGGTALGEDDTGRLETGRERHSVVETVSHTRGWRGHRPEGRGGACGAVCRGEFHGVEACPRACVRTGGWGAFVARVNSGN